MFSPGAFSFVLSPYTLRFDVSVNGELNNTYYERFYRSEDAGTLGFSGHQLVTGYFEPDAVTHNVFGSQMLDV